MATYMNEMNSVINHARLNWFVAAIQPLQHPFGIIIGIAENGKTQSTFGSDMGLVFEMDGFVIDESHFIDYIHNRVELFDNGTLQFDYNNETHYIIIKHWKKFLNLTIKGDE